jgi:hypothetical protein
LFWRAFRLYNTCDCRVSDGDFANNSPLLTLTYKTLDNDDIVQGILNWTAFLKNEKKWFI